MAKLISFFITNLLDHEHITVEMLPPNIKEIFKEKIKDPDVQKLQHEINQSKKEKDDEAVGN